MKHLYKTAIVTLCCIVLLQNGLSAHAFHEAHGSGTPPMLDSTHIDWDALGVICKQQTQNFIDDMSFRLANFHNLSPEDKLLNFYDFYYGAMEYSCTCMVTPEAEAKVLAVYNDMLNDLISLGYSKAELVPISDEHDYFFKIATIEYKVEWWVEPPEYSHPQYLAAYKALQADVRNDKTIPAVMKTKLLSILSNRIQSENAFYSSFKANGRKSDNLIRVFRDGVCYIAPANCQELYVLESKGKKAYFWVDGNETNLVYDVNGNAVPLTASWIVATPTASAVKVDGKTVAFASFNINGSNYFGLRDIAAALNGSGKQFQVGWDNAGKAVTLTSNAPYEPVGGELSRTDAADDVWMTSSTASIFIDSTKTALNAYVYGNRNYFKLRDIASKLNFGVTYDSAANTINIDTTSGYSAVS